MRPRVTGFTLMELSVALLLGALLTLGAARLAQAVSSASRLQMNSSALQENARFALQSLEREIRQAGYRAAPWLETTALDVFASSADNASPHGDRLVLRRWSDRNCYGNENPERDGSGQPRFYLLVNAFAVTGTAQLALTCHYGPNETQLVRQVNNLGLVEQVLAMQALFAIDSTGDGSADHWDVAGSWDRPEAVKGIRVGLALLGPLSETFSPASSITLLNESGITIPPNRLHHVVETSWRVMGHGPE